jgi:glycosyltransferase involved in cell wall biosynthesis
MKVSIIVPAFNEEKNLSKTLESLVNQSYKDTELIVIDNNSTDKTAEIAKTFTPLVFLEEKKGYIQAVVAGASRASGGLVTFCDADTLYPHTWLESVVNDFKKNPKAIAVYGSCKTYDASPLQNTFNWGVYTFLITLSRIFGLENTAGFNFVIKKSAYEAVGGYNPKFAYMSPDIELGRRLKKYGKIVFNPRILVQTSFRRFEKGGKFKTFMMFMKSWFWMMIGKTPKTKYDDYNAYER